jgi:hypothetical protein
LSISNSNHKSWWSTVLSTSANSKQKSSLHYDYIQYCQYVAHRNPHLRMIIYGIVYFQKPANSKHISSIQNDYLRYCLYVANRNPHIRMMINGIVSMMIHHGIVYFHKPANRNPQFFRMTISGRCRHLCYPIQSQEPACAILAWVHWDNLWSHCDLSVHGSIQGNQPPSASASTENISKGQHVMRIKVHVDIVLSY